MFVYVAIELLNPSRPTTKQEFRRRPESYMEHMRVLLDTLRVPSRFLFTPSLTSNGLLALIDFICGVRADQFRPARNGLGGLAGGGLRRALGSHPSH